MATTTADGRTTTRGGAATPPPLTERQKQVLDSIEAFKAENGYMPSIRELCAINGYHSTSSTKHQVDALAARGYVRYGKRKGRTLEVLIHSDGTPAVEGAVAQPAGSGPIRVSAGHIFGAGRAPGEVEAVDMSSLDDNRAVMESNPIPLVGRIAAGTPILAEQNVEDVMLFPQRLTGAGNLFMLEVHGDSMTDAAIRDGDFVIVREQESAETGQIVAALLDSEATVKAYEVDALGHPWLVPRNSAYSPIDAADAQIMGIVVTVVRKL